jgi:hypothetical protein
MADGDEIQFQVDGFDTAVVQTVAGTPAAIVETRFYLANKVGFDTAVAEKKREGDDTEITRRSITGLTMQLDFDTINVSADAVVFGKTALATAGKLSNAYGFGGGSHRGGKVVGVRLEGPAIKVVNGAETPIRYSRWCPQGTLTPLKPGELSTSGKMTVTSYSFTPIRATKDILGVAITGAPTGGEFFFDGEITA